MTAKRVLVFASTFPRFIPGDATPPFVYELSKRLAGESISITVLTPRVPGAVTYEERDGLKIYRYPYFFLERWERLNDGAILPNLKANKWLYLQVPFLMVSGFIHLCKIVKKERIETIHAHWIIPQGFLAVLYKRILNKRIKVICTSHGGDIFGIRGKLGTLIKQYSLKHMDCLTVVSSAIKEKCLELGADKNNVSIIPMGVDIELFHPDKYDHSIREKFGVTEKLLLFVGRLAEKKGVRYLINAMTGVLGKYPKTKLMIIGEGPLRGELERQVKKLNLEENILFLGSIPNSNLPNYYATADIFIGPSIEGRDGDSEGFGLVFVEAILSGCITVGSDIHGIKDILKSGKTGFLVKPGNSIDIQETILKSIENTSFDSKKAQINVKSKFSWEVISKKYFILLSS